MKDWREILILIGTKLMMFIAIVTFGGMILITEFMMLTSIASANLFLGISLFIIFNYLILSYAKIKIQRKKYLKEQIEEAVNSKKIKRGKTFEETTLNYKKYLEERAREECIGDLKIGDKRYCCKKCGYRWESRKSFGEPSICPSCRGDYIVKFYDTPEGKKELQQECE